MITRRICPICRTECSSECAWHNDYEGECRVLVALEKFAEILEIRQHARKETR